MMNNLFSMFDPSSSYISLNWLMVPMIIIFLMKNPMKIQNKMKLTFKTLNQFTKKEMKQLMGMNSKKNSIKMSQNLFMMVMLMNTMALVSYNFTPTAHISLTMSLSMCLWLSIMLMGWLNSFKKMMAHMTPMGTPNQLMNFMVLIELVSNLIRPITLSVRLSANMLAGHLLMSLLSNFSMVSNLNMMYSMAPLMLLSSLEIMVAMVQAFVITTLLTLYHNESF